MWRRKKGKEKERKGMLGGRKLLVIKESCKGDGVECIYKEWYRGRGEGGDRRMRRRKNVKE